MKYLFRKTVQYFRNILLGFDVLLNTITGGSPTEYISYRLGRWKSTSKIAKIICNIMTHTLFGDLHCTRAYEEPEEGKAVNDSPLAGLVIFILLLALIYISYK